MLDEAWQGSLVSASSRNNSAHSRLGGLVAGQSRIDERDDGRGSSSGDEADEADENLNYSSSGRVRSQLAGLRRKQRMR